MQGLEGGDEVFRLRGSAPDGGMEVGACVGEWNARGALSLAPEKGK